MKGYEAFMEGLHDDEPGALVKPTLSDDPVPEGIVDVELQDPANDNAAIYLRLNHESATELHGVLDDLPFINKR